MELSILLSIIVLLLQNKCKGSLAGEHEGVILVRLACCKALRMQRYGEICLLKLRKAGAHKPIAISMLMLNVVSIGLSRTCNEPDAGVLSSSWIIP